MAEARRPLGLAAVAVERGDVAPMMEAGLKAFPEGWLGRLGASRLGLILPGFHVDEAERRIRGLGVPLKGLATIAGERYLGGAQLALSRLESALGDLGMVG